MITRAQLYSIGNEMEPLKQMLYLPYQWTSMLADSVLVSGDSVAATQAALANEEGNMSRRQNSPLVVTVPPERIQGSILSAKG